jgi:hypothetical protein
VDTWIRKENGNEFTNVLERFEYIQSPNFKYRLNMQDDCNLILTVCILYFNLKTSFKIKLKKKEI